VPATLDRFAQVLRDYQEDAVAFAAERVLTRALNENGLPRTLFSSPTGTGKGTIELALLRELRCGHGIDAVILTPSLGILRGFLERCGATPDELEQSEDKLAAMGEAIGVHTPIRYRNQVLKGERTSADVFICDEAHHQTDHGEVSGLLFTISPESIWVGYSATVYRGTPKGTRDLRAAWGEPYCVLTIPEAIRRGFCALPRMRVQPLTDDDRIEVRNGQFVAAAVDKEVGSRVRETALVAYREWQGPSKGKGQPTPTCLVVPSTDVAHLVVDVTRTSPVPFLFIGQHSTSEHRMRAFEECRAGRAIMVVIKVLAEGVDTPWLRAMVDASPTLSPVEWTQRVGRIMRPGAERPRYVCTCRNLERHAYVMEGAIPRQVVADAQQAFPEPTNRSAMRAFGLESLKKFKQIDVPLKGGLRSHAWVLFSVDEETAKETQYVAILHPTKAETIVASRQNVVEADGTRGYGHWEKCEVPEDLVGFATAPFRKGCSDKQKQWWRTDAGNYGLDPGAADTITARQFFVLPALKQLGVKL
jgi:superfamily II DNA or RNA helicase